MRANLMRCRVRQVRRDGFTAVELLAATSLSAMLMVSVMGLVGQLTRTRDRLAELHPSEPWTQNLEANFARDFSNSRFYSASSRSITFEGYGGSQYELGTLDHGPSRITYSIRNEAGQSWLIRSERRLGGPLGEDAIVDIVSADVSRIQLQHFDRYGENWETLRHSGGNGSIVSPNHCRLVVYRANNRKPIFDHVFVRHGVK